MIKRLVLVVALIFVFGVASTTFAELIIYDWAPGLVYDTDYDITWLQDANYSCTSDYDADGLMNWYDAMDWAASLEYEAGGVIYDNWRLPTTSGT